MNIKTLITTLILGTSSVAMANPVTVSASAHAEWSFGSTRPYSRPVVQPVAPVVRDHRNIDPDCNTQPVIVRPPLTVRRPIYQPINHGYRSWQAERPTYRPVYQPQWSMISSQPQVKQDGRAFIKVGSERGAFSSLRLDGVSGRTLINQLYIEFMDGGQQYVRNINQTIDRNRPLTVKLGASPRAIKRIVVYSDINTGGAGPFILSAV